MGILRRLLGQPKRYSVLNKIDSKPDVEPYRWSLYVCHENRTLLYAVHTDCPLSVLGYLIIDFREYGSPQAPWELHLNFNLTHEAFKLEKKHFIDGGCGLSPTLLKKLSDIDPSGEAPKRTDPVCIDLLSNKFLPMLTTPAIDRILQGDEEFWEEEVTKTESSGPDCFCSVITQIFKRTPD
jgi:hypothetical protein